MGRTAKHIASEVLTTIVLMYLGHVVGIAISVDTKTHVRALLELIRFYNCSCI